MDSNNWLSKEKEKAHYMTHNNDIHDPGYQQFVSDIVAGVVENVEIGKFGLDYGAGPGPVVSSLLKAKGYDIVAYDPYFNDDRDILQNKFDFIVCCEVAEHFNYPAIEFLKLKNLLNADAPLIIKTHIYEDQIDFTSWYYHRDPTHVVFYRNETFEWICKNLDFSSYKKLGARVAMIRG